MKRILAIALCLIMLVPMLAIRITDAEDTVLGDASCDGYITADDATLILRHVVSSSLMGQALLNADANQDGKVTATDASAVLRNVVGLDSLPPAPVATSTPVPTINPSIGDVNCDGSVTSADAALLLRYLVTLATLTAQGTINADANNDGKVSSADASAIMRACVGLDILPPMTPDPNATPTPTPRPTLPPTMVPTATPTYKPTATPIPTNAAGLPAVGDAGLIYSDSDPNASKITNFYVYRKLWSDCKGDGYWDSSSGYNQSWAYFYPTIASSATGTYANWVPLSNKNIIGWVYMSFKGEQNLSSSGKYAPVTNKASSTFAIDDPIMYSSSLEYYNHTSSGKPSTGGAPYAIFNSLKKNIVVSAHNSRGTRSRFHHLHSLQNGCVYFSNQGTLLSKVAAGDYTFNITIFGRSEWKIWAMYETGATESSDTLNYNTSPSCGSNVQQWINTQLSKSQMNFGVTPSTSNQFLTFYTCGDQYDSENDANQARLYVFFVYVGS